MKETLLAEGENAAIQQRAEEKKQLILNSAMKLFGELGYHKTTTKAIAEDAGVATGSLYRYFKDKKSVFMAVCFRKEEEIGSEIFRYGRKMRTSGIPEEKILSSMIDFAVEAHKNSRKFHKEVLAMQLRDEDISGWVHERERRVYESLLMFLREGAASYKTDDLEAAAELICYVIEEVCHRTVFFINYAGEERLVRQSKQMLTGFLFGSTCS